MAQTAQALADLTEISSQIESAVAFDREGTVLASTVDDERARTTRASAALELLGRPSSGARTARSSASSTSLSRTAACSSSGTANA